MIPLGLDCLQLKMVHIPKWHNLRWPISIKGLYTGDVDGSEGTKLRGRIKAKIIRSLEIYRNLG